MSMKKLNNKKNGITGGAMGTGFAIVKHLLEEACIVIIRDNNAGHELWAHYGR